MPRVKPNDDEFPDSILISVVSIHGTNAEKKIMADTLTTTTNLVLIAALVTNKDGKTFLIEIAEASTA